MSKTTDLTQGKVTPLVLGFFFPMLVTNMLQQFYNVADTAIVGKGLGDDALAAVGNMGSLSFLIVGFSLGLSNGFSVLTAQCFGAKDYEKMRRTTAASINLAAVITIVLTAVSVIFMSPVLILLQTDESIMKDSLLYGYIVFGGLFSAIAYNMCSGILRALGDSKTPLIAIVISAAVNIVLNCVSIFVLGMGVEGPAIATVLSQLISAAVCYGKLRKIEELRLSRSDFAFDGSMIISLLKNGIPMALMNSITAIGCMVIQYFVNGLGVAYTSAYSTYSKLINIFMQPACTAGFAMSSFASQNYGAGKFSRIKEGLKVCLAIALVSYLILGTIMILFPAQLAGLMLNGEEQISLCAKFMPITGAMLFAVDLLFVFRSGVQGMGYPFIPMCSGVLEMALRASIVALFISKVGFNAAAYADTMAWLGAFLMNSTAFVVILRGKLGEAAAVKKVEKKARAAVR